MRAANPARRDVNAEGTAGKPVRCAICSIEVPTPADAIARIDGALRRARAGCPRAGASRGFPRLEGILPSIGLLEGTLRNHLISLKLEKCSMEVPTPADASAPTRREQVRIRGIAVARIDGASRRARAGCPRAGASCGYPRLEGILPSPRRTGSNSSRIGLVRRYVKLTSCKCLI